MTGRRRVESTFETFQELLQHSEEGISLLMKTGLDDLGVKLAI